MSTVKQTNQHSVESVWMGGMQFNALVNGHTIVMDAPERAGGQDQGPISKPLLLTALSGCTGMDVIALLRNQKITLRNLDVTVNGILTPRPPIAYQNIHLIYDAYGAPADEAATLAAIQRSQNELCGVSYMLKKALPVTWEVRYNAEVIFDNQPTTVEAAVLA